MANRQLLRSPGSPGERIRLISDDGDAGLRWSVGVDPTYATPHATLPGLIGVALCLLAANRYQAYRSRNLQVARHQVVYPLMPECGREDQDRGALCCQPLHKCSSRDRYALRAVND